MNTAHAYKTIEQRKTFVVTAHNPGTSFTKQLAIDFYADEVWIRSVYFYNDGTSNSPLLVACQQLSMDDALFIASDSTSVVPHNEVHRMRNPITSNTTLTFQLLDYALVPQNVSAGTLAFTMEFVKYAQ